MEVDCDRNGQQIAEAGAARAGKFSKTIDEFALQFERMPNRRHRCRLRWFRREASRSDWARKLCAPKFAIVRKGGAPSIRLLRADKRERGRLQNEGKRRARSKRGIECGEASRGHLEAWFVANQPV